jgi:hypothetical protein
MSHHDLTRWIEDADSREFSEAAMLDQAGVTERHYLHFGETIAYLPSWFRHGVSRETMAAIGCHALTHIRHIHDRRDH